MRDIHRKSGFRPVLRWVIPVCVLTIHFLLLGAFYYLDIRPRKKLAESVSGVISRDVC